MDTWKERMVIRLLSTKFRLINLISTRKASKGSIDLLIQPMQGKVLPKVKPTAPKPKSGVITTSDNLKVQIYDWEGDADTTLLIHGWDSNSYRWFDLIDHLKGDNLRFAALDAPYHGHSGGDHFNMIHFANMIDAAVEKFQPVNIIAHSLGALALAYYLQAKKYTRLKNLILLSPVADLSWHIDRYHKLLALPKKTRKAMDDTFKNYFDREFHEFNFRDFEQELDCEMLIIHSADDAVVPTSDSESIHEWFERSKLKIVDGYGHRLQAVEVFDLIGNQLRSNQG